MLDVVLEVIRKWYLPLAGGLAGALLGLFISGIGGPLYQATATLLIQPSKFQTELTPDALAVAAYERLLQSDFTSASVAEQLREYGSPSKPLTAAAIRNMITTSVPGTLRMRGLVEQLPIIELTATAPSPELALSVANTYARVFVGRTLELRTRGGEGSADLLEEQYPLTRADLESTEKQLNQKAQFYAAALARLDGEWQTTTGSFTTPSGI